MKIGEAARATGLTVKAIRHYEAVDLLPGVGRSGAYREFSSTDIDRLKTIAHCRSLGFAIGEVREILGLVVEARPSCPSPEAMSRIIATKQDEVRAELLALEQRAARLEQVRLYVEGRREESS